MRGITIQDYDDMEIHKADGKYYFIKGDQLLSNGYPSIKELIDGEQGKATAPVYGTGNGANQTMAQAAEQPTVAPVAPAKKTRPRKKA